MDTPDPAGDSHCQDQVRRHDRDRFLCAQFAPAEARADLAVLHAFNLEVAQVRETVTEPLIGRMRLQWWRDMLDRIAAGDPPVHPVAQPLAGVMARHGLSRPLLDALIDGREADLAEGPPATLAELEAYADATAGGLAVLALEILGVRDGDTVAAARRVGVAWALTGLIRAVPFQAARGWAMLPADLCAEAGVHPPTPGQNRAALGTVTAAMALAARGHLAEARRARARPGHRAVAALLPAVLATHDLARLEKVDHDPYRLPPPRAQVGRVLRLAWHGWQGRI